MVWGGAGFVWRGPGRLSWRSGDGGLRQKRGRCFHTSRKPTIQKGPRTGLPFTGRVGWEGARVHWPGVSDGAPEVSVGCSGPGHPVPGLSLRFASSAEERGAEPS